jgi:hypothetical protein
MTPLCAALSINRPSSYVPCCLHGRRQTGRARSHPAHWQWAGERRAMCSLVMEVRRKLDFHFEVIFSVNIL